MTAPKLLTKCEVKKGGWILGVKKGKKKEKKRGQCSTIFTEQAFSFAVITWSNVGGKLARARTVS